MCAEPKHSWTARIPRSLVAAGMTLAGVLPLGCLESREPEPAAPQCVACHGSVSNSADELIQSAPPSDLFGNQDTSYPGVGAHAQHLFASETHAAVACEECHQVPKSTRDPGHADSDLPAELTFGQLASHDEQEPKYNFATRRCSNTYCHGADRPRWTRPRTSAEACGSCHGLPPKPPHPQSSQCSTCHAEVVDEQQHIIAAALHVNGKVEAEDPGCRSCHGSEDNAAPPRALDGETDTTAVGVGAHQVHLTGGEFSRALQCEECHLVPEEVGAEGHLDALPAEVQFVGVAAAHDSSPSWKRSERSCMNSWCHSFGDGTSPTWTNQLGSLSCASCHGMPPPEPHPQSEQCGQCHAEVVAANNTIRDRQRHVDGKVDVDVPEACDACHGADGDPAPPPDLMGNTDTSAMGVGAHRAHLTGNGRSRPLQCGECHLVPTETQSPGHLDTALPAEVQFGAGPASAFLAEPEYREGGCAQTFCHGDSFIGGRPSGGSHTRPQWTDSSDSAASCQSCHGMPPPEPHPQLDVEVCGACHQSFGEGNRVLHPERHIDGSVTFFVRE